MKRDYSFLWTGIVLFVVSFFFLITKNAVNIPQGDDFYCLLLFTQDFQDAPGFFERMRLLTEQWVEHRIVYSRMTALLSKWMTGQVNFITIILIGNLTLPAYCWLFWKILKKTGVSSPYYLLPVLLVFFSPVTYEGNLWAGASTVYMPVGFLGILTIYLLVYGIRSNNRGLQASREIIHLVMPLGTALMATFSFGNGMFCFPAGVAVLIYKRMYRAAWLWGAISVSAVALYFTNFETYSSTESFNTAVLLQYPGYFFLNLFGFAGGILDYTENVNMPVMAANIPALILGFFLLLTIGIIALALVRKWKTGTVAPGRRNLEAAWIGMAIFVVTTALVMAWSRTNGEAMNTLSSRYKIYSMLLWALVYTGLLLSASRQKLIGACFGLASLGLLLFNYYTHYGKFVNYKSFLLSGLFNYNYNGQWIVYRHTSYYEVASKAVSDSISTGKAPVYFFNPVFPGINVQALSEAPFLENVNVTKGEGCQGGNGKCLAITADSYPSVTNRFEGIYLVVYNASNIYLFAATPLRNDRKELLRTWEYFQDGFLFEDNFGEVLKGKEEYSLAVFCPTETEPIKRLRHSLSLWNGIP